MKIYKILLLLGLFCVGLFLIGFKKEGFQNSPSPGFTRQTMSGPSTTSLGPSTTSLGPSTTSLGPSTTSLGPSTTSLGPSTTSLGPSSITFGPSRTILGGFQNSPSPGFAQQSMLGPSTVSTIPRSKRVTFGPSTPGSGSFLKPFPENKLMKEETQVPISKLVSDDTTKSIEMQLYTIDKQLLQLINGLNPNIQFIKSLLSQRRILAQKVPTISIPTNVTTFISLLNSMSV